MKNPERFHAFGVFVPQKAANMFGPVVRVGLFRFFAV
jgi:hypothetical protein